MNPFADLNARFDQGRLNNLMAQQSTPSPVQHAQNTNTQHGHGGFLSSLISEGGALGGAATGAAIGSVVPVIGTALGGIIGGGLGAFGGRIAENKVRDNRWGVGDAAKEGALTAVLSGPGKLLKYGSTASKALTKGGASLEEALSAAATKASAPGMVSKAVSNKLASGADNLATRALKLNGSKFNTDFANKTGEEVGQFANRLGLVGKTPDQIMKKIYEPAQKVYAAGLESIGTIPKSDVQKSVQETVSKLAKSSFKNKQELAQQITQQADELLAKYGDAIPATELNSLKNEAYDMIDKSITDKAGKFDNNTFDILGNSFRKAINSAADRTGVSIDPKVLKKAGINFKSTRLGDFGHELRALNDLTKQIDVKSRVGKGSSIFGLNKSSGAIGGGVIGGPAGAAAGIAASTVANSPKTLGKAATGLEKGANLLASQQGIPGAALRGVTGATLADILMAGNQSSMNAANNMGNTPNMTITPSTDNMSGLSQNPNDLSTQQSQSPYGKENLLYDIQRDPNNAAKYIDYYNQMDAIFNPVNNTPKLNSTAAGVVADTQTGLNSLSDLYNSLEQSNVNGPGIGQLRALNPFDTNAQTLQQQIAATKQIVGKALEGGVLRKEDEAKYAKILPTLGDTDAVAKAKIQQLYSLISQRLNQYQSGLNGGGGGPDLTTALMQSGYGQ